MVLVGTSALREASVNSCKIGCGQFPCRGFVRSHTFASTARNHRLHRRLAACDLAKHVQIVAEHAECVAVLL